MIDDLMTYLGLSRSDAESVYENNSDSDNYSDYDC